MSQHFEGGLETKIDTMVKVRLQGPDAGDSETLWASLLSADLYRLENSPFFAYGLSWQDVIEASEAPDGMLEYVRSVTKSGNRTLRIFFEAFLSSDRPAEAILKRLTELRCSYEGMKPRLIAVNIPSGVNLSRVTDFLTSQAGIKWEYADPTYEEVQKQRVN